MGFHVLYEWVGAPLQQINVPFPNFCVPKGGYRWLNIKLDKIY